MAYRTVIKAIYRFISRDEERHGGAYLRFMRRAIERCRQEAKRAFAKIGVLMASPHRAGKPLHPTNLHVNSTMFPMTRCKAACRIRNGSSAGSMNRSISTPIGNSAVSRMILKNLSSLFGQPFETVQQLNRFRKGLVPA